MATTNNPIPLPAAFLETTASRLPGLAESLDSESPVSIRFNPFKPGRSMPEGRPVPWAEPGEALYLDSRPLFTADPVFHGGAYYVQEAGSMFIGWLLRRLLPELDTPAPRLLDLCAAPGGKTTHLASIAGPGSVVVANEVIRTRAKILAENVQKWGTGNVAVTSDDPAAFGQRLPDYFDLILVDAPCSGEGMFRKDHTARAEWSPDNVQLCVARQRRIVSDVWEALRPGGILIYSTCTFNDAEDEANAQWIADELGGELLTFDDLPSGIVTGPNGTAPVGWHFYPHRVASEGFYAAVIRKHDAPHRSGGKVKAAKSLIPVSRADQGALTRWLAPESALSRFTTGRDGMTYGFSEALHDTVSTLLNGRFTLLYSGVQLGTLIRGELKPEHALALYYAVSRKAIPAADLPEAAALEYLRKGTSTELLPVSTFAPGLNLVTCRGIALGWVKRIGNRYNNLYPAPWRILHY